jgi:hypothetical protein
MIEAELPDGTILEFPDNTPDSVVDSVVRKHMGVAAPATPMPAGEPDMAESPLGVSSAGAVIPTEAGRTEAIKRLGAGTAEMLGNVPESGYKLAEGLYEAVTSPIETATSIYNLGKGALQLALPDSALAALDGGDPQAQAVAKQVGQFFVDRYGSIEAAQKTLVEDPVGAMADLSSLMMGGGAGVRAVGTLPKAQSIGEIGKALQKGGEVIEPMTGVAKGASALASGIGKGAGTVGAYITGTMSGAGQDAIYEAYRVGAEGGERGKAFRDSMRGKLDPMSIVDEAQDALKNLRQQAQENYRKNMAPVSADESILNFDAIDKTLADIQKLTKRAGQTLPRKKPKKVVKELTELVNEWKTYKPEDFHTPEGMDELKKAVGDIVDDYKTGENSGNRTALSAATQVYNSIKNTISDQAEDYKNAMKEYADAQADIDNISRELSLKPNALPDSSLRKLISIMRDNVATNYGMRAKRVEKLEEAGADTLTAKIAGQELQTALPKGIQRAVAPITTGGSFAAGGLLEALMAATGSSPRVVGETAHLLGRVGGATSKAAKPAVNLLELIGQPELLNLIYQQERALQEQNR